MQVLDGGVTSVVVSVPTDSTLWPSKSFTHIITSRELCRALNVARPGLLNITKVECLSGGTITIGGQPINDRDVASSVAAVHTTRYTKICGALFYKYGCYDTSHIVKGVLGPVDGHMIVPLDRVNLVGVFLQNNVGNTVFLDGRYSDAALMAGPTINVELTDYAKIKEELSALWLYKSPFHVGLEITVTQAKPYRVDHCVYRITRESSVVD